MKCMETSKENLYKGLNFRQPINNQTLPFQKTTEEKEEPSGKKSKTKPSKNKTEQDEDDERDSEDYEDGGEDKEEADGEEEEDEDEETNDKIEEIKKPKRKPVEEDESDLDSSRFVMLSKTRELMFEAESKIEGEKTAKKIG